MTTSDIAAVTILGDGQMALVLADALVASGREVRMVPPRPGTGGDLARTRRSERLPDFELDERVEVIDDGAAVEQADWILNAVPAQFVRPTWSRFAGRLRSDLRVGCVTKGIEIETRLRPSEVLRDVAGIDESCVCALSGPTIAAELARRLPATMLAAARAEPVARAWQDALDVPWLRIYTSTDLEGVELAGALKNVIALAAGMIDGLGMGANAKSALLARGLAEIVRLGTRMGAQTETFFGVAGLGDLATTCFSPEGRNRTCGERLGRGETLHEILEDTVSVVEGVPTTRAVMHLAREHDADMPITSAVHRILFEGLAPDEAVRSLMARPQRPERIG